MTLPKQQPLKAIALSLTTFFLITSASSIVKTLHHDISIWTILFFQYSISLMLLIPTLFKTKEPFFYKKSHQILLILRGVFGAASYFFMFLSLKTIPLLDGILLWNTAPLWVPFIMLILLKTKIPNYVVFSSCVGFMGIAFTLHPQAYFNLTGSLFALIAGVFFASTIIISRKIIFFVSYKIILFYYFAIASLLSLPMMLNTWHSFSDEVFFKLLFIGCATYYCQTCFTLAGKFGPPRLIAPMAYSAVLFSAIFDWLFWDLKPHWFTWLGAVLIIFSGGYNTWREHRYESHSH